MPDESSSVPAVFNRIGGEHGARVTGLLAALKAGKLPTLRPFLPALFRLKNQPYSLDGYEPFSILFRTDIPRDTVLQCARQVSKSQSEAMRQILFAAMCPNTVNVHVMPLFEMTRRFSQNYVARALQMMPARGTLFDRRAGSVLEKNFHNGSTLAYTFASTDDSRARGYPADRVSYDEYQSFNAAFTDTINETTSASKYKIFCYSGTPFGRLNGLNVKYRESTASRWATKCLRPGCGHWNIAAADRDLMKMLGPAHTDVSPSCPGTVCAKCQKPLDCSKGQWHHDYPERRHTNLGIHVPQPILPMHSHSADNWAIFKRKQEKMTRVDFSRECLGEPEDYGIKPLSEDDLKRAAILPWPNRASTAASQVKLQTANGTYLATALGVDWGGAGGGKVGKPRVSFTKMASASLRADGRIDVAWGIQSKEPLAYVKEARMVADAMGTFGAQWVAHDYNGGGANQESLLLQAGLPMHRIKPIRYTGPGTSYLMTQHAPTAEHPRPWWALQKGAALALVCFAIRTGLVRFFKYDWVSTESPGLLVDFLALTPISMRRKSGSDVHLMDSDEGVSDDFAHAVTFACCSLWAEYKNWPDLSAANEFIITRAAQLDLVDYDDPFSDPYGRSLTEAYQMQF